MVAVLGPVQWLPIADVLATEDDHAARDHHRRMKVASLGLVAQGMKLDPILASFASVVNERRA